MVEPGVRINREAPSMIHARGYQAGTAAAMANLIVPIAKALRDQEAKLRTKYEDGLIPMWEPLSDREREPYLVRAREIVEGTT